MRGPRGERWTRIAKELCGLQALFANQAKHRMARSSLSAGRLNIIKSFCFLFQKEALSFFTSGPARFVHAGPSYVAIS
jgi:hypothetical protein